MKLEQKSLFFFFILIDNNWIQKLSRKKGTYLFSTRQSFLFFLSRKLFLFLLFKIVNLSVHGLKLNEGFFGLKSLKTDRKY